jgi:ribosome biogenesis GTPase
MGDVSELQTLGWDDDWEAAFEPHAREGLVPGRVAVQHRGEYDVLTAEGERRSRITSRLRRKSRREELPIVGDWVALDSAGAIAAVLPRRTTISRRAAHEPASGVSREQVIAANVDVAFVVHALGQELDPRLIERYVALSLESGARPVVLLTKTDLEPDPASVAGAIADLGGDIAVLPVSARSRAGLEAVRSELPAGSTGVLLGPSGVGKSTLVNALVGDEARLATGEIGVDGAGRHTTTRRELVLLPEGGMIVDNPGMREVHLWIEEESLVEAFEDIAEFALSCRFTDCHHDTEPGCAVRAALESGELSRERFERYRALERELAELADRLERRDRSRARRRPDEGAS